MARYRGMRWVPLPWLLLGGLLAAVVAWSGIPLAAREPATARASASDGAWDALLLPARWGHTAVWDPTNSQMLVFAGLGSGLFNDLWAYRPASDSWVPLTPLTASPPARYVHTAVWDPTNSQMLVFGGLSTSNTVLNDLWAYQPGSNSWTQLNPTGGPPAARYVHTAVWDPTNSQMLVFAGWNGTNRFNDLWAYRPGSNSWTQLNPTGLAPAAREAHTAVWDAANAQMLVFGGYNGTSTLNDLWAYRPAGNLGTWTQLSPTTVPPPVRYNHTAVWDTAQARMLVFGGFSGGSNVNDLWAYRPAGDSGTWAQLSPASSPPARRVHTAVWDPGNAQMLVLGGFSSTTLSDLWTYRPGSNSWVPLSPTGAPPPARTGHTAVWNPVNAQMLFFGGCCGSGGSYLNDLWAYRPGSTSWVPLSPTGGPPPARSSHTAVWDPVNAQMLVFGGYASSGSYLNDLWAYRPGSNSWVQLSPTGGPPPGRCCHTAVWDPVNAQMLVFGGFASSGFLNDLWAYRPESNSWVQLSPTGGPPSARSSHTAVWDPVNAQMLVFGGSGTSGYVNDLWAYRPGSTSWVQLSPTGGPPATRYHHEAVWDLVNAQMLVFGGYASSGSYLNDLWAYRPGSTSWVPLSPTGGPPSARSSHTAVWDPVNAQMLVFGGYNGTSALNDLWAYRPPPPSTPTATSTSTPTRTSTPTPSSTPARTPTVVPTATTTPYPRPNIGVQVAPSTTRGQLQTTITARDANCSPNNQLQTLWFALDRPSAWLNVARVEVRVPGASAVSVTREMLPYAVELPSRPATVDLVVHRLADGATTVQFRVIDGCGEWPTFVGGGASAF